MNVKELIGYAAPGDHDRGAGPLVVLTCPACRCVGRPTSLRIELGPAGSIALIRCPGCRTEYWRPRDGDAVGGSEYWEDYKFVLYQDPEVQRGYEMRYARFAAVLEQLGRSVGTVLDVGGGIGTFARWASQQGLVSYMTDVDASAVDAARQRGVQAFVPSQLGEALADGAADTVTLWDVIEHTADPETMVREALRWLAPGGTLFVETPDVRFPLRSMVLAARALSRGRLDRTSGLYYWEHKVYFSQQGLEILLRRCGARPLRVQRWASPSAKMVKLLRAGGSIGQDSAAYRELGRIYPQLANLTERLAIGNKLIVFAAKR